MNDLAKAIGQRIRNYRTRRGLSQERLAELSGCHPTYIGQLERGEKNASLETVEKVCQALEIPMSKLFENLETEPDCAAVLEYCWTHLPRDIAVTAVEPAPERFHARLNARAKRYVYRIWNSPIPNVFERKFLCQQTEPMDVEAMRRAADYLCGTHDFRSFCGLRRFKKSTVRTVTAIEIERLGPEVRLRFTGNGFLNQMVRILTGTLVEVGLGLRTPEEMPAVLNARDRSAAGRTMPPEGLILDAVFY